MWQLLQESPRVGMMRELAKAIWAKFGLNGTGAEFVRSIQMLGMQELALQIRDRYQAGTTTDRTDSQTWLDDAEQAALAKSGLCNNVLMWSLACDALLSGLCCDVVIWWLACDALLSSTCILTWESYLGLCCMVRQLGIALLLLQSGINTAAHDKGLCT